MTLIIYIFIGPKAFIMKKYVLFLTLFIFVFTEIHAQQKANLEKLFSGISMRNIGPAFMSGRISDIAIHPQNPSIWYIATGSGGVWKTINSGTTWKSIFDSQKPFSIGCVTIDPNNPHRIWVGTGENVGGRHMSFGDGIYLSEDDGKTWKNMGLKKSEHISKIIVNPDNSNIIYVASQGPLWSSGGERGFYLSEDGGKTWEKTLGDDKWTGVTDIDIDPRNPQRIYAATWQRHRTIANYMGGGWKSAIYRSEDGGKTWKKIMKGIKKEKAGKIALAVSPQKPDIIYAAVEHNRRTGSVYKSTNRGESWIKQSDAVGGGTGPHYYQELWANPHYFDVIYLASNYMLESRDGGKHFTTWKEENKHVDNHALAFRKDLPDYMLVGTDGGLYETFDGGKTWKFIRNLPVTQFYKIAVDDSKPFYYIYGGTQDNSTQRAPSQTDNMHGIANRDWEIVLFADGHQPATIPGNPNIVYAEWQQGNLVRKDMITGESVYIKPQPREGEPHERYNWDAPVLVSPHHPKTLYVGSYRLWKSTDMGDSWTPVSGDLTQYSERFDMPIMGKKQSWDSPWDVDAMSEFHTITSLSESPVKEGIFYVGTDDGLIQVTSNGGKTWRKIPVSKLPGCPQKAYVNDIKADLFDANTVYVSLDNHKEGDYNPYLYKSTDLGKTWKKITGNLKAPLLMWRLVQDYKKPGLLFAGTEFGTYFTINGGKNWNKIPANANISFRDLAIQKNENDLVGGSFGRGIFILDNYDFIRQISNAQLEKEAALFDPGKSYWYFQRGILGRSKRGTQGDDYFLGSNPPYGTTFTYYIKNNFESLKDKRQKAEKKLEKTGEDIPFPGWKKLDEEITEQKPGWYLEIKNKEGLIMKRLKLNDKKGFHRVTWNHTRASKIPGKEVEDIRVAPGKYQAQIIQITPEGDIRKPEKAISFEITRLYEPALKGKPLNEVAAFWEKLDRLNAKVRVLQTDFNKLKENGKILHQAYLKAEREEPEIEKEIAALNKEITALELDIFGSKAKREVGERTKPGLYDRLSAVQMGVSNSSYGPTPTHLQSFAIAQKEYERYKQKVDALKKQVTGIKEKLEKAGAPYIILK